MLKTIFAAALAAACLLGPATDAQAQAYPSKPIRLVVPFPPGGNTDIFARLVGQKLTEAFGQQVVVDNRPGAGGNIGADAVAKAEPDGYTLVIGTVGTHGINPSLYGRMPYDVVKDFEPVAFVADVPNVMVVNPARVKAKTVPEFIAEAKARPGTFSMASSGSGTSIHISGEMFKEMAGINMTHVPYKGSAPAVTDLIGGQVDLMFDNLPSSLQHIKAGSLRAIAVTSPARSPALPDVPTVAESGLAGFEATSWNAIFAPKGTPREIVERLNAAIVKGLESPDARARFAELGGETRALKPAELGAFVGKELERWGRAVKASGAKVD